MWACLRNLLLSCCSILATGRMPIDFASGRWLESTVDVEDNKDSRRESSALDCGTPPRIPADAVCGSPAPSSASILRLPRGIRTGRI